jgi:hypothetical protein
MPTSFEVWDGGAQDASLPPEIAESYPLEPDEDRAADVLLLSFSALALLALAIVAMALLLPRVL